MRIRRHSANYSDAYHWMGLQYRNFGPAYLNMFKLLIPHLGLGSNTLGSLLPDGRVE
jgi:hypothetical protein